MSNPGMADSGLLSFRNTAVVFVIALLGFLSYSNTFSSSFHFDDYRYVVDYNAAYTISDYWPPYGTRYLSYLSFALNYLAGGEEVFGYHLVNFAIHAANGTLVFLFAGLLMSSPRLSRKGLPSFHIAFLAALLFTLHPVQTEAVTYISQRFASLSTLFYLAAVVFYLKWRLAERGALRPALYLLSLGAVYLGQMTKEIIFTVPFTLLAIELAFFEGALKRRLLALAPFLLALAVIPFMLFGPGAGQGVGSNVHADQLIDLGRISKHDYLVTQFRVIATYLRLLVLPIGQTLEYDYPIFTSIFTPEVFASFILVLSLFSGAVCLFSRFLRGGSPYLALVATGVVWFFVTISVESSIIPIQDVIFEHRLYLPSVGAAIAASSLLFFVAGRWGQAPWKALAISFVIMVLPLGAASYARNAVWHDGVTLYEDAVKKSPGKERARFNLARAYNRSGEYQKAIEQYNESLKLKPGNEKAYYDLARIYMNMGEHERAIYNFGEVLKRTPADPYAHHFLGMTYAMKGDADRAIDSFYNAIELRPFFGAAHYNLGLALIEKGDLAGAEEHLNRARSFDPSNADILKGLGRLYAKAGDRGRALEFYGRAIRFRPELASELGPELERIKKVAD